MVYKVAGWATIHQGPHHLLILIRAAVYVPAPGDVTCGCRVQCVKQQHAGMRNNCGSCSCCAMPDDLLCVTKCDAQMVNLHG